MTVWGWLRTAAVRAARLPASSFLVSAVALLSAFLIHVEFFHKKPLALWAGNPGCDY